MGSPSSRFFPGLHERKKQCGGPENPPKYSPGPPGETPGDRVAGTSPEVKEPQTGRKYPPLHPHLFCALESSVLWSGRRVAASRPRSRWCPAWSAPSAVRCWCTAAGVGHRAGGRVRVPDRRRLSLEDGPRERRRRTPLPRASGRQGQRRCARLAAPGRPVRLRGPLPLPAVGRHAQAGGAGAEPDQRAAHPPDGRAVQRPRRADPVDHVQRAACRCGT